MTPTHEMLALARRVHAERDDSKAYQYREGLRDDYPDMQATLAAIIETTEAAAKLCEDQQKIFGSTQYATGQPFSSFGERFACGAISEALRSGDHLKGQP